MGKETTPTNLKKKRKTNNPEETEVDIYRRVVDFENKEVTLVEDFESNFFHENFQEIKRFFSSIYTSKTHTPRAVAKAPFEALMRLSIIRKLNRIDKLRHVKAKEQLNTEKLKCDSIKLSYQNLVYELQNIIAEKNTCLSFKSQDEDIELVPFEEFMQKAPEDVTKKFTDLNQADDEQQHNLHLAELEWELRQRKDISQLVQSLIEEQKNLEKDLVELREKLNTLKPLLLNIIEATKPLLQHLDVPLSELRMENSLASLLPDPLHIFYIHIIAYKTVNDLNLTVEIQGDEEEALRLKEASWSYENSSVPDDDSDQEVEPPEVEEVVEVKKRRHRKSVQQVDPMEEKKKKLLEIHPLHVNLSIKIENGPTVIISFKYCMRLKIVSITSTSTVPNTITGNTALEILSGESILSELIEGDSGMECPNPLTSYQLKKVGLTSYENLVPNIGYAYQWAQKVCGTDFVSKVVNSKKISSITVENVVKILFKRLEIRFNLAKQFNDLEQKILPKCPKLYTFAFEPVSSITKFANCSYQKYCHAEFTQSLLEEEFVHPKDYFYILNLERGNATLQAFVVIKRNYPDVQPIFSISITYKGEIHHAANDDDLRDMERILNSNLDLKTKDMAWILSYQIIYLSFLFDIYLETTDPKKFTQQRIFIRDICGRNRKKPFKFHKMGSGIFSQY